MTVVMSKGNKTGVKFIIVFSTMTLGNVDSSVFGVGGDNSLDIIDTPDFDHLVSITSFV